MSDDLVFYTNPMSRGRIVRWMLEELGQPYRTVVMDFGPAMKSPEYLAINPMGKVPAVRHGETVVTEVAAICAYLADAFPQAGLAPPVGSPARGAYYRWLFFCAGPLEASVVDKALGVAIPEERQRMVGYGSPEQVLIGVEAALSGGDYVGGQTFSAADLYLCAQLGWGMQFGTIEKRPSFEGYVARLSARPAAIRAREIDDALLKAAQP